MATYPHPEPRHPALPYTGEEVMSEELIPCPQCGEDTKPDEFDQGVCSWCAENNQLALDQHNRAYDAWQIMTPAQRDEAIRKAIS